MAKFKDDTDGIGYYEVVKELEENFEEKKAELIANLRQIAQQIFRKDNLIISYTSSADGLAPMEEAFAKIADTLHTEEKEAETPCDTSLCETQRGIQDIFKSSVCCKNR